MTRKIIEHLILGVFFAGSASLAVLAFGNENKPVPAKPQGRNCELLAPPTGSGEEGGHGVLVQVYPRTQDIDSRYSGCQAVFWTTAKEPARLAWLVEVFNGDPVRRWSPDPSRREISKCIYAHGALMQGVPDICPLQPELLMPSQAAGCFTNPNSTAHCDYDGS